MAGVFTLSFQRNYGLGHASHRLFVKNFCQIPHLWYFCGRGLFRLILNKGTKALKERFTRI